MSESIPASPGHGDPSREEMMSALFASMVMQQAQMAMLYLGRMPHPETGQPVRDFEAARMFIDQLEMLEVKTRGNLSKEEAALLKQSLSSARLAFVQAVEGEGAENKPATPPTKAGSNPSREGKKDEPAPAEATGANSTSVPESDDRKKFVKKY
jgi:hypothetical protein